MNRMLPWAVVAVISLSFSGATQAGCKVLDPELQGSYSGACGSDGFAEGLGAASGKAEYTGGFHAGKKQGHGVKLWPSGDRYVGEFVDDRKEGQGIYSFGVRSPWAGDRHIGGYRNDRRNGYGIYEWSSGERFEGQWENDAMTGPPTAMALQRARHLKAVKDAVMKSGVTVCRDLPLGVGGKETMRGHVGAVSTANNSIAIILERAPSQLFNGAAVKAGDTVWDAAINWEPCN